jgi:UDP-N-acetylglucosamine 3-dehydrogenase
VLVEKPIATSVEEADDLVAQADEAGVVLAAGHVERFNPAVRALKRRIEAREMGDVLSLVARRVGVFPAREEDANVILDLAIHDVDVFRYLLDADRPDDVYSNAGKARNGDLYDFADVFLRFGSVGCLLQVNWLTPVKIRSLAVTGTLGYGELEYVTQRLDLYRAQEIAEAESFAQVARYSAAPPERVDVGGDEPLRCELDGFLRAVAGKDGEIVSGRDAALSLGVVGSIIDAVDGGRR